MDNFSDSDDEPTDDPEAKQMVVADERPKYSVRFTPEFTCTYLSQEVTSIDNWDEVRAKLSSLDETEIESTLMKIRRFVETNGDRIFTIRTYEIRWRCYYC